MALYYALGGILGGALGYFVLYKMIGCQTGTCPITANPYTSIIYGAIMGALLVSAIASGSKGN